MSTHAADTSFCKACGSKDLVWQTLNVMRDGALKDKLTANDVLCKFVFVCKKCSETQVVLTADKVAAMMNNALD